ncbi:hypothetical protein ACWGJB_48295 [Streptomyces sp. NPDC054813]
MGVEGWVGCERSVLPPLPPALVPGAKASLSDEPLGELPCEPPPLDAEADAGDIELSWSCQELLQPPRAPP